MDIKDFTFLMSNPGKVKVPVGMGLYGGEVVETLNHIQLKTKLLSLFITPIKVGETSSTDSKEKLETEAWKVQLGLCLLTRRVIPLFEENYRIGESEKQLKAESQELRSENMKLNSENLNLKAENEAMKNLLTDEPFELGRNMGLDEGREQPVASGSAGVGMLPAVQDHNFF